MFLNRLSEAEKNAFLQLAHHIARTDNRFSEEEELLIAKYCMEMQMDDIDFADSTFDLSTVLGTFEENSHRKIVLLEIMSLVYADGVETEEEKAVIKQMIALFGLNPNLAIVYREWAKSILALYIQGEALIHL